MWWLVWFLLGGFVATTVFALSGKARKWAAGIDDSVDDEAFNARVQASVAKLVGEKKA
jgi:hypothetical protein